MVNVNYKELEFYKRSYELSILIYKIEMPKTEIYGLQSQIRRCATSISLNIAEGTGRSTIKDYKSFLYNALGSCRELEVLLDLSRDLNYINLNLYSDLTKRLNEIIGKMINYMKRLEVN